MRLAIFEQKVNDRSVFQGELKISIDRSGRIIQSLGNIAPYAAAQASAIENLISPQEALVKTMATVDVALDVNAMSSTDSKADQFEAKIKVDDQRIKGDVESRIVYFPVAPGIIIPAWSQTIWSKDADYLYANSESRCYDSRQPAARLCLYFSSDRRKCDDLPAKF